MNEFGAKSHRQAKDARKYWDKKNIDYCHLYPLKLTNCDMSDLVCIHTFVAVQWCFSYFKVSSFLIISIYIILCTPCTQKLSYSKSNYSNPNEQHTSLYLMNDSVILNWTICQKPY